MGLDDGVLGQAIARPRLGNSSFAEHAGSTAPPKANDLAVDTTVYGGQRLRWFIYNQTWF
ncbi:hypothetical protein [Hymenobacter arizonensis]|uniref:hypothetical protein n=1 Tax=Hymenobacter arizonensis TaxID=1227077 RepID=UPI001160D093|nr:hypothetical protein [Hymenobacter arizonensis]